MSSEEVTVHVGRDGPNTLTASASSLEVIGGGTVGLVLDNRGTPVHAHCRLTGDLAAVASLERSNYFVDAGEETYVPIQVPDVGQEVRGTLEVSTGYGANAVSIELTATGSRSIALDETLGEPRKREPEPSPVDALADGIGLEPATLGVLALGVVAVGVALSTAAVVGGTSAFVGVLVVGVGVLVALWLLVQ